MAVAWPVYRAGADIRTMRCYLLKESIFSRFFVSPPFNPIHELWLLALWTPDLLNPDAR